jgi:hypothetical protein
MIRGRRWTTISLLSKALAAGPLSALFGGASAEMKWINGISLAATFEGEFSAVTQ